MPLADDVDLTDVAARTDHFTGADLEDVVRRAGLIALRQKLSAETVTMADFEKALTESRASVTPEMEEEYRAMSDRLKQNAVSIQPIGFVTPGQLKGRGSKGAD